MAAYALVFRADGRFPFCIDRKGDDGSWTTLERWPTKALAFDRIGDIQEELDTPRSKQSNAARRLLNPLPHAASRTAL